ncbi:MAG TPA: DedA family protein [Candidatus Acidoferrales bacterium]|nr:DedA family protein [Candidatus Acidoferrales bacterium]
MGELEGFLRTYGLWALFFFAAFEGDLTLLLAGMLVHLGIWPLGTTFAIATTGALTGDCFYFWLGHGTARRWLTTAHGQRVMPRIERSARRYGIASLFFARYIYGTRIATMFFWGMQRISVAKFVALDALNCVIWASVFGGLGYFFADQLEHVVGELRRVETWLLVGLVVFAALLGLRHFLAEFTPPKNNGNNKQ